jgi:hypothetical protein
MSNTIKTNSLATLVAIRAAESAGYLTVGSRKYFKNQLEDKRNGQTYRFVIRDAAEPVNALAADKTQQKVNVVEREVSLTLDPWHVLVETNAIEKVTDLNWDVEIATPNGQKLINAVVKKAIDKDLGKVGTAFIGSGFTPLSQGSAHLGSITNEELYGFCDPNVEAILTSNGQQFVPVAAPDMYSKGLLGKFHGAEYRAQRFFPCVKISNALAAELAEATVNSLAVDSNDATKMVLTLNGVTETIKKGTPLFIEDVYATDMVGDPTSMLKVFVALKDTPNGVVSVQAVDYSGYGTREIANEDGSNITLESLAGKSIIAPEAGKYYMAQIRCNGVEEFETLEKLDAAGADYEKVAVEGINLHQNRLVDLEAMTNNTRWDIVTLAGTVEPRGVVYAYIK